MIVAAKEAVKKAQSIRAKQNQYGNWVIYINNVRCFTIGDSRVVASVKLLQLLDSGACVISKSSEITYEEVMKQA